LMDRQNDDDCLERIAWTDNILIMWDPQSMDLGEEIIQDCLVIFRREAESFYGTKTLFESFSSLVLHRNRSAAYEEYPEWHRKLIQPAMNILVELAAMMLSYPMMVPSLIACLAGPRPGGKPALEWAVCEELITLITDHISKRNCEKSFYMILRLRDAFGESNLFVCEIYQKRSGARESLYGLEGIMLQKLAEKLRVSLKDLLGGTQCEIFDVEIDDGYQ
ncbi:hypothetical protein RUND412_011267, partial [Rhizina undulata]